MCTKSKLLINHPDGHLALCECGTHLLCFKNIHLEFTPKEFGYFINYINYINIDYWKNQFNCYAACKRNIPIPTNQGNLILVFNADEFLLLKAIVHLDKNHIKKKTKELIKNYSIN